ncbi:AfsR/SARP family transcriptional regulator [Streptomyces buecherae]|uniref:AfsR/SARP family transcriptional regulator n=1 Tax=Streptomyces buecherae TaxID=2763006 RepID=UPI0018E09AC4|nr:BTAD domain-containing putative transcriptional regulator [Streptomyces buecherae]
MRFGVLGPLAVWTADGAPVPVPGAKVRVLLARLLVDPGRPVAVERLVDALWDDDALPAHPINALQGKVSQLRRVLAAAEPGGRDLLTAGPAGYALRASAPADVPAAADGAAVDAAHFAALLRRARDTADPRARVRVLTRALELWRGEAFADFADRPFARAAVTRLDEDRLTAWEERAEARLALGEHTALTGELSALVERYPLRERLRAAHLRALYLAGRPAEALAEYAALRRRLADELGLSPSPELAALQQAMLRQDPSLDAPPAPPGARVAGGAASGVVPHRVPGPTAPASPRPGPGPGTRPGPGPGPGTRPGPGNLPAPVSPLIGRANAVSAVAELLGPHRLVTLTGPGGVGKTRLALAAAARLRGRAFAPYADGPYADDPTVEGPTAGDPSADNATTGGGFPEGVWLVELATLDTEAQAGPDAGAGANPDAYDAGTYAVVERVLKVLAIRDDIPHSPGPQPGLGPGPGPGPDSASAPDPASAPAPGRTDPSRACGADRLDRLVGAVRAMRMLLVLDNCEHLVEPVGRVVAALLRAAPGLCVLATSQEPLGVAGERVWPVPPLGLPAPASDADPSALEEFGSVQLFVARAASAPGFALSAANAPAVAALCRRLDGLPLALELAAARVRTLGVHGLAARLDERLTLLSGGHRDAPARHRTLRTMIDWSWGLLTDPERAVLRQLAVFAGGCTPEAAEAVCGQAAVAGQDGSGRVLDVLARLVERSLVVLDDGPTGPRYRLLESVSAYGAERLRAAGEADAVRERHGRYYADLAERVAPRLRGPEQRHWLERLDDEGANLRRALDHAVRHDAGGDRALRLVNALAWYWVVRGRLAEAGRALAAALATGPHPPAAITPPRALATAWHTAIALTTGTVEHPSAIDHPGRTEHPGHVAEPPGPTAIDAPENTEILGISPTTEPGEGCGSEARIRAVLRAYDALDDPHGRATALWLLGTAQLGAGDVATGEELVDQALAGFRALGDTWGTAAALSVRARHAMARGDLDAVRHDGELSARLFRGLGDRWGQAQTVFPLATLAEITGDYPRATRLHRAGLEIAEELGLGAEVSRRHTGLGRIALLTGDTARARAHHTRALHLARAQNFRSGQVSAEIGLALGARAEGDHDTAERHLDALLDWFRETGYGPGGSLVLAELGFVAELRGDAATALARHLDGYAVAGGLGDPRALALALEGLAGARALAGAADDAAALLGAAAAARDSVASPLPPAERTDVDRVTAAARAALGAPEFAAAFAHGTRLSPADAVRNHVPGLDTGPAPEPARGPSPPR